MNKTVTSAAGINFNTMNKLGTIFILSLLFTTAFCQTQNNNTKVDTLATWERKFYTQPLNNPFLFYVIYGNFSADFKISQAKYRYTGLPNGCDVMKYDTVKHSEVLRSFLEGYLWKTLQKEDSLLAKQITDSKECFVLRGDLHDTSNLDYLRNAVGIITYLLDHGGIAVYDPQAFSFAGKAEWNENIFAPNGAVPRNHVIILISEENGTKWYHTRGLRKFGRPDLSIHNVTPQYEDAVYDLFNRFIEFEGFGGIIADKQKIKMQTLPQGMWCENKGDFEDPDFNNKHVEIHWK